MRVPEFLKQPISIPMSSSFVQKGPYSKLEAIKDIKDELDQPLQPHIESVPPTKCSTVQAFGNTVKSFVGVGMLALPYAIKQSGLWAGIIGLVIIGFVSAYTMKTLVRCKIEMELRKKFAHETNHQATQHMEEYEISYGDIGHHIFGKFGLYLVNFAIMTSQLGFCCAYILFIGENLNSLWPSVRVQYFALVLFPLYILLSWIRNMKYLAPTSIFANMVLVLAVAVVFYFGFSHLHVEPSYPFVRISTFPLFFGIAVFGYEGINLAIPIQSSMINPRAYPRMLDLSLVCVGIMYVLFGSLGYLFFGEDTNAVITTNLPNSGIVTVVKICLVIELLFSYPVQLFPVTLIIEAKLLQKGTKNRMVIQNILRAAIVTFTVVIAMLVPHFDLFTSLVGAFSNSMVVFMFPTLFLISIFRGRLTWPEVVLNIVILVFGIVASAISSAIAIIAMIDAL